MRVYRDQLAFSFEEPVALPYTLTCADVLKWAKETPPLGAHALLCDAPYEISFMSRTWDSTGIAFKPETWKALAQHLLPGAFVMCFAGARTYHRLACALEDAGLIIHPSIFLWTYGSGFPKATRIHDERFNGYRYGGQTLKPASEPLVLAQKEFTTKIHSDLQVSNTTSALLPANGKAAISPIIVAQVPYAGKPVQSITQTGAGSLWIDGARLSTGEQLNGGAGKLWSHYRDGTEDHAAAQPSHPAGRWPPNFALSHLSLPVFRLKGHLPPDTQDAITRYYAGYTDVSTLRAGRNGTVHDGLEILARDIPDGWIDYFELTGEDLGCVQVGTRQVPSASGGIVGTHQREKQGYVYGGNTSQDFTTISAYKDANGMEEVPDWRCADQCPVRLLDLQAGVRHGAGYAVQGKFTPGGENQVYGKNLGGNGDRYGDEGQVSRFFHVSSWELDVAEQLAQADPAFYCAKASRSERDKGLDGIKHVAYNKTINNNGGTQWEDTAQSQSIHQESDTPHQKDITASYIWDSATKSVRNPLAHTWIWEQAYGPIPKGYQVHHKNHDKEDNRLDNLELVDFLTHKRIHSGCELRDGQWWKPCKLCGEFKPITTEHWYLTREGWPQYGRCRPCHIKKVVKDKQTRNARRRGG